MDQDRKATGVRLDPRCGHITICGESGPALVTMVDTGSQLELWSHEGAHVSPEVARMLGRALLAWADRKTPLSPVRVSGSGPRTAAQTYAEGGHP